MSLSCHTLSKALDLSRNIPPSHIFEGHSYNQKMHKYEQKEIDTHMNQKIKNLLGYNKEDSSFEGIQK